MIVCFTLSRAPLSLRTAARVSLRTAARALLLLIPVLGASACVSGAPADVKAQALVAQSTATLQLFKSRQSDTAQLFNAALRDARGIMIFPDVFEAAVGIGGQGGSGLMVTRDASGAWGYPGFYRLSGGSVGVQLGAQSRDIIFLLMSDSSVRAVIDSPAQFGIGAQATFGESGSGGGSSTNIKGADIIGFTKGSGVFAGAALSGAYVNALGALNQSYYHGGSATPAAILIDHSFSNPDANQLRQALVVK